MNPGPGDQADAARETQGRTPRVRKPGEKPPIVVTSYNVRGLKDEKKLRHLLSHYNKKCNKDTDLVACLQETYLDSVGKLPYLWRGNFFITESEGNSGGCLTLLSNHLTVVARRKIENRGHIIACSKNDKVTYVIANIYAPNQNTVE